MDKTNFKDFSVLENSISDIKNRIKKPKSDIYTFDTLSIHLGQDSTEKLR